MWKSYPEYNRTVEEWITAINPSGDRAYNMRCLHRALKRAISDRVVTKAEQKTLLSMIKASDDDCYVALKALEEKYKLIKIKTDESINNLQNKGL